MLSALRRAVVASIIALLPGWAAASTWEIDPAHTSANFAVRHLVISTVRGRMGQVTGSALLDESDVTKSSVTATIDAKGVDTREVKRDEHLRGPDFLDVAAYPTITFKSKKVEPAGAGRYKVTGDLTLHGVTREVTLDVTGSPTPMKDPFGNTKLGGVATTTLNRQDFGIAWSKALDGGGLVVGDEVEVTIDVELTKKN
jgi:polyisoprenoid-binding protein YceI